MWVRRDRGFFNVDALRRSYVSHLKGSNHLEENMIGSGLIAALFVGMLVTPVAADRYHGMFDRLDSNQNGVVSLDEWQGAPTPALGKT